MAANPISRIAIVTTTRADYGIYRPLLAALRAAGRDLHILAGGTHPVARFGRTLDLIRADNLGQIDVVDHHLEGDTAVDLARSCGGAVAAFGRAIHRLRPDLLFVLGDRFEMLAAGLAAALVKAPIAHLHGGDLTEGAYDDQFRHALTKLSHLHFPALPQHADRILAMGEEPWRVHVVGSLALDELAAFTPEPLHVIARDVGLDPAIQTIVISYHPETLADLPPAQAFASVAEGLAWFDGNVLAVGTNADEGHLELAASLQAWARQRDARLARRRTVVLPSMDQRRFWSWLSHTMALVGNSSSAIIEAPTLGVPAVNVGGRQSGRVRAGNVIDAPCEATAIAQALRTAIEPGFRQRLAGLTNPYGDGRAAERILSAIESLPRGTRMLRKRWTRP